MKEQLFFDLDFATHRTLSKGRAIGRKRTALQRAVLRWLEQHESPTGIGTDVITRISRLKADVAGFWSVPVRNEHEEGPGRILVPERTMIVQCHPVREDCWPDCMRSQEILPQLRDLKARLHEAEKQVRADEPHLRETNTLFEEYAEWRYEDSENEEYHRLKQAIEKMEHGLYHGTKFERIRSAQLADFLYLAVPVGVVSKEELADGWGLLWVEDDLRVRLMAEAEDRSCLPSNRFHLVQNIAAAAKRSELFLNGVCSQKSEVVFVRPPKRRRGQEELRLSEI